MTKTDLRQLSFVLRLYIAVSFVIYIQDTAFIVGVESFAVIGKTVRNTRMGYFFDSLMDERRSISPEGIRASISFNNNNSKNKFRRPRFGRVMMIGDIWQKQQKAKNDFVGELYCSAINNDADESMSLSSSSSISSNPMMDESSFSKLSSSSSNNPKNWKDKLLAASNFASILCVVDCTLLPAITFILPLLGLLTLSPTQMTYLHTLGHQVALYFVMPIGITATVTNYFLNHKKLKISLIGIMGLSLIYLANSGGAGCGAHDVVIAAAEHVHHHHHVHAHNVVQHATASGLMNMIQRTVHAIQHGLGHRVANLMGCSLLILSNYISRKMAPVHVHGPNCSHTIQHVHGPNCKH